jgi:hypothetical protein
MAVTKLSSSISPNTLLTAPTENVTVSNTGATGTINFDVRTQGTIYVSASATGNWTLNVRGNSTSTLNSLLAVGRSITISFLSTNGSTAYYNSALTIDGNAQTVKWVGGTAPSSGYINGIDMYTYTIIKTAATPTYLVLGQLVTRFA